MAEPETPPPIPMRPGPPVEDAPSRRFTAGFFAFAFAWTVLWGALLVVYALVVPRFINIYDQLGAQLPILTRLVVHLSGFIIRSGPGLLLVLAGHAAPIVAYAFLRGRALRGLLAAAALTLGILLFVATIFGLYAALWNVSAVIQ